MAEQDSDFQALLRLAQQGDRDAIGQIYVRYGAHVERVTRFRLQKMGLATLTTATDIHDSVFRQLLKPGALDKITTDQHLRNFLVKACANKVNDMLAKRINRQQDLRETAICREVEDESHQDLLGRLEQEEELERLYAQLLPRERLLCTLRRAGCGWDEIAERLNTTPEVARQAFSRGFRRARRLIRESGSPPRRRSS